MVDAQQKRDDEAREQEAVSFYGGSADYLVRLTSSGTRLYAQVARHALWRWAPPQANQKILDLGCGTGEFARLLAGVGYGMVIGADLSESFVREAVVRHGGRSELRFVQLQSAPALPFADGTFDGVTAVNVIEHLAKPGLALAEVARVLRPGGIVVLTFPNLLSPLRPLKRFVSRDRRERYGPESGESVRDSLALVWRNVTQLLARYLTGGARFVPREADFQHANLYYELGYGADYDALWLCNPVDVRLKLQALGISVPECTPFPVADETQLGRLGRLRTRLPAALSSPTLCVGRK